MIEPTSVQQHRQEGPDRLNLVVVTVSDTRTLETDTGGALVVQLAEADGHQVVQRQIVPDDPDRIGPLLLQARDSQTTHAVLLTGGTGIAPRDQTYETVSALLTKEIPGYGELFRMLSYQQVQTACILSRAMGGLIDQLVVLTMPGSRNAIELAMTRVILPEIRHLVREARKP